MNEELTSFVCHKTAPSSFCLYGVYFGFGVWFFFFLITTGKSSGLNLKNSFKREKMQTQSLDEISLRDLGALSEVLAFGMHGFTLSQKKMFKTCQRNYPLEMPVSFC